MTSVRVSRGGKVEGILGKAEKFQSRLKNRVNLGEGCRPPDQREGRGNLLGAARGEVAPSLWTWKDVHCPMPVRGHSSPHPRRSEESGAFRDWGRTFRSPPAPGQPRRCLSLGSVSSSAAPVSSRFRGVWLQPSGSDGCQGAAVDSGEGGPKSSPASPRPPLATAHPPGGMQPRSNHAGPENARGWGKRHCAPIQQPFIHDSLLPKKARAT